MAKYIKIANRFHKYNIGQYVKGNFGCFEKVWIKIIDYKQYPLYQVQIYSCDLYNFEGPPTIILTFPEDGLYLPKPTRAKQ